MERVVFLGGAITPLLVTDPGATSPRPTLDVDIIIEVATAAAYARLREDLRKQRFEEDVRDGAPICRWVVAGCTVDVMPTDERILGFSNRWYPHAMRHRTRCELGGALSIWIATAPLFIATKLEAFHGRGGGDYRASHDLEDVIAVIDGRPSVEREVAATDREVGAYIMEQVGRLLADRRFEDALPGYLPGDPASQARLPQLRARLASLCSG